MITFPRWFPELNVLFYLPPLVDINTMAMYREMTRRYFVVTRVHIRLIRWRGEWLFQAAFDISRMERPL